MTFDIERALFFKYYHKQMSLLFSFLGVRQESAEEKNFRVLTALKNGKVPVDDAFHVC